MNANENKTWHPIPFAPDYFVSDTGVVASIKPMRNFAKPPNTPRSLTTQPDKDGYLKVVLRIDGVPKTMRVCRIVCWTFHGPPPKGQMVRHLDGSKNNDTPDNLAWGTPKDNSQDMLTHNTRVQGDRVNTSRFTEKQVKFIRQSERGHSDLAREFGVTPSAIWHIRVRKAWKHV